MNTIAQLNRLTADELDAHIAERESAVAAAVAARLSGCDGIECERGQVACQCAAACVAGSACSELLCDDDGFAPMTTAEAYTMFGVLCVSALVSLAGLLWVADWIALSFPALHR